MIGRSYPHVDPTLDLLLERTVPVRRALVWDAWTMPEHLVNWFAPLPYTTSECQIDLHPGGRFRTVLRSPDGHEHATDACYLEVREHERLIWTTALGPGFRPTGPSPRPAFTAVITLEPAGQGTKYSALAMHSDPDARTHHADLGFHDGWSTALDQLVAMIS